MQFSKRARILVTLVALAVVGATLSGIGGISAQEASPTPAAIQPEATEAIPTLPPPPVSTFLEAQSVVEALPAGRATVSLSILVIAPRVALRSIVTNGPVIILVDSGTLTLDADSVILGQPEERLAALLPEATPGPSPAAGLIIPDGGQVTLPANTRAQLRNTTDEEVELVVIAIAPEGLDPFGAPAE